MIPDSEQDEIVAAYERDYAILAAIAEELGLADHDAHELIENTLYASLTMRIPVVDPPAWLTATFRAAVRSFKERS